MKNTIRCIQLISTDVKIKDTIGCSNALSVSLWIMGLLNTFIADGFKSRLLRTNEIKNIIELSCIFLTHERYKYINKLYVRLI